MPRFRTVLVAADFSGPSEEAFRAACALANDPEARLLVLHVADPNWVTEGPVYLGQQVVFFSPAERGPEWVASLKGRLRAAYAPDRHVDVEYQVREGEVAGEILRASEEIGCDLIALGTHGRTGLRRLLTGSVAEAVLRRATRPVLALRAAEPPRGSGPLRVILHPTDFSEDSAQAFRVAAALARDYLARLIVLHVMPAETVYSGVIGGPTPNIDREGIEQRLRRLRVPELPDRVEHRLRQGEAATEILYAAAETRSDLIVMGTSGRTGLGRLVIGSVAEAVLRGSGCPVLVVKAPAPHVAAARPLSAAKS
jgi:nucleotide-binding universal stress UspA family protein